MIPDLEAAIHGLALALGGPPVRGCLRARPEDFEVQEIPLIEPAGQGEHVWLLVRKRLENTAQVARNLARLAGAPQRDVGYAGLKDRNAVTTQWFSVCLPGGTEPDWRAVDTETVTLLHHARHHRKLRRGALRGNAFRIRIRDVTGQRRTLEGQLRAVAAGGVPNYVGEQRFGRGGSNLRTAERLFSGAAPRLAREPRGLALSAARSFLFNQVLSRRVETCSWDQLLPGDALQLDGTHSFFVASEPDDTLRRRVREGDVHPTGPLYGQGDSRATGEALRLELDCLAACENWRRGLAAAGLHPERRSLRLPVSDLQWSWPEPDSLELRFSLPAGGFATSILRELVRYRDQQ